MDIDKTRRSVLLKRQNLGNQLKKQMMESVVKTLNIKTESAELVPLQQSDDIVIRFFYARHLAYEYAGKEANYISYITENNHEINAWVQNVLQKFSDDNLYLFRANSNVCGAIKLSLSEIAPSILLLVSVEQEEIWACSYNGSSGIFLTYDTDNDHIKRYRGLAWYNANIPEDTRILYSHVREYVKSYTGYEFDHIVPVPPET